MDPAARKPGTLRTEHIENQASCEQRAVVTT